MQPLQPLDIADQLTQLHDNSLRELFDVIDNHKSALHDLVQQAQAELTALVGAPAATSSQQAADVVGTHGEDVATAAATAAAGSRGGKRRAPASSSAAAQPPTKRGRGRPRKAALPTLDENEEAEGLQQQQQEQPQQADDLEDPAHSVSVTVLAHDPMVEAEDAITAPPGRPRRTARQAAKAAAAAAPAAEVTHEHEVAAQEPAPAPKRGRPKRTATAAAAAGSSKGCSTRGKACKTADAAEPVGAQTAPALDAIMEDETEQAGLCTADSDAAPHQQQQQQEPVPEPAPEMPAMDDEPADIPAAAAAAADAEEPYAEGPDGAAALVAGTSCCDAAAADQTVRCEQAAAADAAGAHGSADPVENGSAEAAAAQAAEQPRAADSAQQAPAAAALAQPGRAAGAGTTAAAGQGTPGFQLAAPSRKLSEAATPSCFDSNTRPAASTRRTSARVRQQQQPSTGLPSRSPAAPADVADDTAAAAAGSDAVDPAVAAAAATAAPTGLEAVEEDEPMGPKSLSFGFALQGPLLVQAEAAAAAENTPAAAAAAPAPAPAAGIEDNTGSGWKAFMSTIHASDAPTPASSRQRSQAAAAAAAGSRHDAQQGEQASPAAGAAATAAAPDGLTPGRRVTRNSMRQSLVQASPGLSAAAAAGRNTRSPAAAAPASAATAPPAPTTLKAVDTGSAGGDGVGSGHSPKAMQQGVNVQLTGSAGNTGLQQMQVDREQDTAGPPAAAEVVPAGPEQLPAGQGAAGTQDMSLAELGSGTEPAAATAEQGDGADAADPMQTDDAMFEAADEEEGDEELQEEQAAERTAAAADDSSAAAGVAKGDKQVSKDTSQQQEQKQAAGAGAAAAAAAPAAKSNLVSSIRSFMAMAPKKEAAAPAAGKVKTKVKALEAAMAAKQAEEARAQEKAARQQRHKEQQAAAAAAAVSRPEAGAGKAEAAAAGTAGTPSGAVAQSKVAAKEQTVSGLSGSGGAVRVLAPKQAPAEEKPADRDAVQKKAERDAEAAKRAMDRSEKEDRMKRAEQKRKEEDARRRAELAEKQRQKDERVAAAAALKANKMAAAAAAAAGAAGRAAAGDAKPTAKQAPASTADNSSFKTPAPPKAATRLGGAEAAAAAAGGKAAAAGGGGGDSPPLTITVLDPVSTGGKGAVAKTVMGPPASKTPAAFKTPAPPVSEQDLRNIEALKSSPYVNTSSKRTPYAQQLHQQPSYIISPYRDDDTETPDRSHKPVPDWAKPAAVLQALKAQRHVDPDTIFGAARRDTCDLAEMFKDLPPNTLPPPQHRMKLKKLGERTSSSDWSKDRLTWQEDITYKKELGYL